MQQILNSNKQNNYISKSLINKYIYYKDERTDSYLYYIFSIKTIDPEFDYPNITYFTNKCYLLYVPKNKDCQVFVYDNYDRVNVSPNKDLYELTFSEFVNTFRIFIENHGKKANDLPDKIIQDIVY